MAALFGPLAGVSFDNAGTYFSAPSYTGAALSTGSGQAPWWRYLGLGNQPVWATKPTMPVYPSPPVRNFDTPGVPLGPAPAPGLMGTQKTRADRLFGPFVRVGSGGLAGGGVSFPGM
jgi:hypothetical protein